MKKRYRKVKWGLILLIPVLGSVFYTQYPKLTIISGYAAKNIASNVYLAKRNPDSVIQNDLQVPHVSLANAGIVPEDSAAEASVFGMQTRRAVYRQGLGSVLIPDGKELPENPLRPSRIWTSSPMPYPIGQGSPVDTIFPEVDYPQLQKGVEQAFKNPEIQRTRTVLVLYDGHLVAERFVAGFGPNTPVLGWSMTKSVLATLYGILEFQGKVRVTEKAGVTSWGKDARRDITLDDLLRMQSGLAWKEDYSGISDVTRMLFMTDDMATIQADKPLLGPPGSIWNYSSGATNLLSGLLRNMFENDQQYLDFPYRELVDRIGMNSMILETDLSGNFVGSSYAWASTRDWGRFGLLYMRRGDWFGDRIFDADWVDYVSLPTQESDGSYGAHFWLNLDGKYRDAPRDMFMANGYQGQHVFIIPSKKLVIVRTGLAEGPDFDGNAFLRKVLSAFP